MAEFNEKNALYLVFKLVDGSVSSSVFIRAFTKILVVIIVSNSESASASSNSLVDLCSVEISSTWRLNYEDLLIMIL